jgi:hypothetical protein
MKEIPLYQAIARRAVAVANCHRSGNDEWLQRHRLAIRHLVRNHLPSGSGIDNGVHWREDSTADRLRFALSFHHMNADGFYDGWTDHVITVRPDLAYGFALSVSGRDRNGIKDYLAETMHAALAAPVSEFAGHDAAAA